MLSRSPWERFRSDRRAVACLLILCAELLAVLLLPPLLGLEPNASDLEAGFWAPPSAAHPLGTDDVGRDLLARLLCGGRVSLLIGLCSAALSALVGIPLGLLAGYRRGAWEFCLMRLADVFQSFPSIVLVLCLVSLVGPSALNLVLVLGLLGWTGIARLVYGNTLSVREKEYVLAARPPRADSAEQCAAQRDRAGVVRPPPAGGAGHPLRIQPELSGGGYPHAPGVLGQPDPVRRQPACPHRAAVGVGAAGAVHHPDRAVPSGHWRRSAGRAGPQIWRTQGEIAGFSFQHGLFCAIINSTERSGPGHSDWGRLFYL